MLYRMMNCNHEVLRFDFDEQYLHVVDNTGLPYELRDYVKTSEMRSRQDFIENSKYVECIRDFLSSRLLSLSRSGAKTILNVANFSQSFKMEERVRIAIACRGLSMTDNFWLQAEDEDLRYEDICLRKNPPSSKSYDIAILQHHVSATREELWSDLTAAGMYPKFWRHTDDNVELWKTDTTADNLATKAEIAVSELLDHSNIPHVRYREEAIDGRVFAVSKCFVNDDEYFVSASDVQDYLYHTKSIVTLDSISLKDFANMVCIDYVIANTDRHLENFGFRVSTATDKILGLNELYDHNNALLADYFGTDIDELVYEPAGVSFIDSLKKYATCSDVLLDADRLPTEQSLRRYQRYMKLRSGAGEYSVPILDSFQ